MKNPWIDIPLADYEAHMDLPHVGQTRMLSDLFAEALGRCRPRSVALLGCAGGNGLERIQAGSVLRVVGVDLNPAFIEEARRRFSAQLPGLELFAGDVQTEAFAFEPVELVFAGLLFEYVDVAVALKRVAAMLTPGGRLVAVVQMPSETAAVTPSPYTCLKSLAPILEHVDPGELARLAAIYGLREMEMQWVEAGSGKTFCVQVFERVQARDSANPGSCGCAGG
jgi:SAM-dependent methyltransferase